MTEDEIRKDERERLARMIEHHPDRWWSSSEVASAVRRGERCHPECAECELETEA